MNQYQLLGQKMLEEQQAKIALRKTQSFDTLAVHGLYDMQAQLHTGSINEPLFLSPAQAFENSDHMETALAYQMPSWTYSRIANPNLFALENTLALLEGYDFEGDVSATLAGSGMAAIHLATQAFLTNATAQTNFVASASCYGGTFMLFAERYGRERGIDVRWIRNNADLTEWESQIDEHTRFLFTETPSNPIVAIADVSALAKIAHEHGLPLLVDSTLATPALQRPLSQGADVVLHSVSKSLACSGMVIAGAVVARHNLPSRIGVDGLRENFAMYLKTLPGRDFGAAVSPFSALMALNDIRTLRARMDYFSRNSLLVAQFLETHPLVARVLYPGLSSHPSHAVAKNAMWLVDGDMEHGKAINRYGHLLAFQPQGDIAKARKVFDRLRLIQRATDLGRIKSIATIPAISTHQQQGEAGRTLAAIPPNLIRLNVGGENPQDVIADLEQALAE